MEGSLEESIAIGKCAVVHVAVAKCWLRGEEERGSDDTRPLTRTVLQKRLVSRTPPRWTSLSRPTNARPAFFRRLSTSGALSSSPDAGDMVALDRLELRAQRRFSQS